MRGTIGMKAEIQEVCTQLLAATANGVYQGIFVALLVGLFLRVLVRTNAATRYAIWFATLLLLVLAIPAHYWLDRSVRRPMSSSEPSGPEPTGAVGRERFLADSTRPELDFSFLGSIDQLPGPSAAGPVLEGLSDPQPNLPPVSARSLPMVVRPLARPGVASGVVTRLSTQWQWIVDHALRPVSLNLESPPGLTLLAAALIPWAGIALIRLLRLGLRLLQLRTLAEGSNPPGPELAALFARLRKEATGQRQPELRIFERNRGPVVLGFNRPLILLPEDLAVSTELTEAEHVLRHELAHLLRYDDWANLAQQLVQAVLFFHPAVWWIGRELSLQREIACDDYVLQHAGGRRSYALTLTSVASRIQQPMPLLASGISNNKSQLQQRINMILNTRRNSSPGLAKARLLSVLSAISLLAVLALCAGPRFGLAQTATAPAAAIAASTPTAEGGAVLVAPAAGSSSSAAVVIAQADGPFAPTPAIGRGPKFKPESSDQEPAEPSEIAAPEAPDAPPVPEFAPRVVRVGKPGRAPRSPDSMEENPEGNPSIEDRLRRLEKMVKELASQQNPKHPHGYVYLKDGADQNINMISRRSIE